MGELADSKIENEDKVSIFVDGFCFTRGQACFIMKGEKGNSKNSGFSYD